VVIKRSDEGIKTPDEPLFRGPGPSGGNRGPVIPVYVDIPMSTPGGGRADAPPSDTENVVDIWNRGNNPYQVTRKAFERIREQARSEKVAAKQAAQVRMGPVVLASFRHQGFSKFLNGKIPCLY